jgi:hypothetical protein
MVERLWSGELPEFNSVDAANELIGALITGLWNRLTRHQDRSAPFRLVRRDVMATREGLATLAMIRCRELDGFVEGLFGDEETIGLPERAHRGLDTLSKMRALMAALSQMAFFSIPFSILVQILGKRGGPTAQTSAGKTTCRRGWAGNCRRRRPLPWRSVWRGSRSWP